MKKLHITSLFLMFGLCLMSFHLSAQNPPVVKNAKTGAVIKLGPMPVAVFPVKNPNGTPIASKTFNFPGGAVRNISLYKTPLSKPFALRKGAVVNIQDQDPTSTCVNLPINAESGNFEMANFAPTDFIFPGSVVDGMSIPSGEYRQIAAPRNPMAMAISLTNGGVAPVSAVVNTPNVASVREAINQLTAQANFSQGVEVGETRIETVYSSEDVALVMDVHARSLMGSIGSSVSYTTDANKLTLVKIIRQRYYSVDVVPPAISQDFFADPNTAISPNWTYISSVKYGRIGILVMTFESKSQQIEASLETKLRGLIGSVSGSIDSEIANKFKSINVQTFQFGGPPMNIAGGSMASLAAVQEIFQRFDNWTKKPVNNPQPIAYSLRFVQYENGGPAIASLQSTLNYNARRCVEFRPKLEVTLKEIKCIRADDGDGGSGEDIYCMLTSKAFTGDGVQRVNALFNQPEVVLNLKDCATRSINTGGSYLVPNATRLYDIPSDDRYFRVTIGGDIDEDDNCGVTNTGSDDEYNDEGGVRTQRTIEYKDIGTNLTTVVFDHKSGNSHIQQVWTLRKVYQ
ncbi:thiol-activated cytolysin family protein [Haliscomenobacter hydrossis]|uniref:Thiol-activated cytolysin n=1 Tax=Haliscomenobacter hydrossis (strain ATCC 27775 / DSM 1100 / LMG 10767 / O) TaxID=760192 RepID=F4KWQ2_HALH1|nr:thiol-activated cytolysin family protein [Haliscomenobacter hydrossis]AEE52535.1 hypothetical protein Halhy_4701 [Haliscomenobacter hydrossis DSM 1100]